MNTNFKQFCVHFWDLYFCQTNSLQEFPDHRSVQIFANEIQEERKDMLFLQPVPQLQVSNYIKSKSEHTKGSNLIFAIQRILV